MQQSFLLFASMIAPQILGGAQEQQESVALGKRKNHPNGDLLPSCKQNCSAFVQVLF